jgi:hypothetical protein
MDHDAGVTIWDGYSRLRLVPIGTPQLGFPTRIEVECGPFAVAVEVEARFEQHFRQSLVRMHETMKGEACLLAWSQEHSVVFSAKGRGDLTLVVNIADGSAPRRGRLTVEMRLDQSYLPGIIRDIACHFPEFDPKVANA